MVTPSLDMGKGTKNSCPGFFFALGWVMKVRTNRREAAVGPRVGYTLAIGQGVQKPFRKKSWPMANVPLAIGQGTKNRNMTLAKVVLTLAKVTVTVN